MGFLDNLKDRLLGNDDYYDDDDYDDYEDDEPQETTTGILGNTRRPEADSVSVYTRSGRPLKPEPAAPAYEPQQSRSYERYDDRFDHEEPVQHASVPSAAQLPPYVLRPVAYDDVQSVVRRVRTNQPVVLVFKQTDLEVAKRILDFCFGLSFGVNGSVEELGDRVFAITPAGRSLSQADIDRLVADGTITR